MFFSKCAMIFTLATSMMAIIPNPSKTKPQTQPLQSEISQPASNDISLPATSLRVTITGSDKDLVDPATSIFSDKIRLQHGMKSERPVYVEVTSSDGQLIIAQNCGIRIAGGGSRAYTIPSLRLYARKEYSPGLGSFKTDIFQTPKVSNPKKTINKYDKLLLRGGGDDLMGCIMRDEMAHYLASEAGFTDYEACLPAVVYINDQYYSMTWLHEVYCDKYFKEKYGDAKGEFIIVEGTDRAKSYSNMTTTLEKQAVKEYNEFYTSYFKKDLTDDTVYKELCKLMDVENYLRYFAFNIYIGNNDWPHNNFRCYRYYSDNGKYKKDSVYDGRWRYLLHDMDNGLGMYLSSKSLRYRINDWANIMNKSHTRYSPMFTALMQREDCKKYFIDYTKELMATVFNPDHIDKLTDLYTAWREPMTPDFFKHLDFLYANEAEPKGLTTKTNYYASIKKIKDYMRNRYDYAMTYLDEL